ncbi:MAG TPA: Rab family GTPase [Spirochaetota bacterium]|nr:GTP-binding protein [Spirochaetota bacterium]HOD15517.1 Rab family GTPase [Spirochaetota bacterium]HPG51305.1 Rab family GTPase [Spirochaetota bacterium]HPN13531.1 Rab family GTPase [Spirochaetota bacterium]HQL84070.1 Rab family GTPase [Spirochaetota bacterium]
MEYKWKITILGDFAVGKTSLVQRFVYNTFSDSYLTTIGVKVSRKEVKLGGTDTAMLLLWDIAGTDLFTQVSHDYLRGASGAIIVGDISRKDTLASLEKHLALFREINPGSGYVIAVNKTDLIGADAGTEAARRHLPATGALSTAEVFATSALDGRNVESMFTALAKKIEGRGGSEK